MVQLSRFHEKVVDLDTEEEIWRKTWKHKDPCDEWNLYVRLYGRGFCKHYAQARYIRFKKEIDSLWDIGEWDGKVNKWVYISNK